MTLASNRVDVARVPRVYGADTASDDVVSDDVVAALCQLMPDRVRADANVPHQTHQCSPGTTG